MDPDMKVEVVYATPEAQVILEIMMAPGASVRDAIVESGILDEFPEIDHATAKIGIYGNPVTLDTALKDKDRVEIYRPLLADPKEARRLRAGGRARGHRH